MSEVATATVTLSNLDVRRAVQALRELDSLRDDKGQTLLGRRTKMRILVMLDHLDPADQRLDKLLQEELSQRVEKEEDGAVKYKVLNNGEREPIVDDPIGLNDANLEILEMQAEGLESCPKLPLSMLDSVMRRVSASTLRSLGPLLERDVDPDTE